MEGRLSKRYLWGALLGGLLFFHGGSAYAKPLPEKVAAAYKAYLAAVEANDGGQQADAAYAAWRAAEKSLGDSKTTGDLAHNYAMVGLIAEGSKKNSQWDAFDRAIALSSYYGDSAVEVEVQRRLMMIDARLNHPALQIRNGTIVPIVNGQAELKELERVIERSGLENSTYAAEMSAMWAKYYWLKSDWSRSVEMTDKALEQFETAELRVSSVHAFTVRFYKARSLEALGDTVQALMTFQGIVDLATQANLGEKAKGRAYPEMFDLQDELTQEGRISEATDLGYRLVSGDDFDFVDVRPIVRIPPIMPPKAERSGWVSLRFDINDEGRAINIEALESSESYFEKSAVKSVENWVYATGISPDERENIETIITYRLTDSRGRIIPFRKPKPATP